MNFHDSAISYSKKFPFAKWSILFLYAFFALLPFSIKTILFSPDFFSSGKFNPYLTVFLYSNDIILFISLIFWGGDLLSRKNKISLGNKSIFLGMISFFFFSQLAFLFTKNNQIITFFSLLRLLEGILLYLLIINLPLKIKTLCRILISTFSLQSFLSLWQYYQQKSLGLYLLGESHFSPSETGAAKIDFLGQQFIRGYGTLPHPNILGGLLVIIIFLTLFLYTENKKLSIFLLFLQLTGLISTFSRSALLAVVVGLFIYFFNQKLPKIHKKNFLLLIPLLTISLITIFTFTPFAKRFFSFPEKNEINERLHYYQISEKILLQNPFGIGLNQFTNEMQNFTTQKLLPWEHQPVHNTFLLIANETGYLNLLIIIAFFLYALKMLLHSAKKLLLSEQNRLNRSLLSILGAGIILFNFDHYFFTNYQAFLTFILIIALISHSLMNLKVKVKKISF